MMPTRGDRLRTTAALRRPRRTTASGLRARLSFLPDRGAGAGAPWDAKLQNALPVFNLEILYAPDRRALQPRLGWRYGRISEDDIFLGTLLRLVHVVRTESAGRQPFPTFSRQLDARASIL